MTATTCTLTGKALAEEAKRLDISGRSKMTAAELRARITERYRAKIVAEYRAACTEYATHQTPGAAKRLAVADSAREAAGIRSVDIPTPDGCPDGCPDTLSQVTDNTPGEVDWDACPVCTALRYYACAGHCDQPGWCVAERGHYRADGTHHPIGVPNLAEMPDPNACPVTGLIDCADRYCELHYMGAPIRFAPSTMPAPVPFRARNGKRKLSRTRIHRRTRAI